MTIQLKDIGKAVLDTEYAVRGPIVARAQELERQGREIIYCNIGNPQALEQKPLTYLRQVLALCQYPDLIQRAAGLFPPDVLETAQRILKGTRHGLGAYSESKGVRLIREAVADFIRERDGMDADPESIYLTDGASKGVQGALRILISGPQDGIMIPIPQYPLYSATITLYEGKQVGYYLDEGRDWKLSEAMLEESLQEARRSGVKVKAICALNPGNPTGSLLDRDNIAMLIRFAKAHGLAILADEVYQENIYLAGDRFVSFARVMVEQGETDVSLFSFHSCSKGFLGECGQRGGYMEVRNIPGDVAAQLTKLQSVSLCANLTGQVAMYCMVRPPLCAGTRRRAGRTETAGRAAGRRAEPDSRHPVQRGGRGDVRVSADPTAGRAHGCRLLHGAARGDRCLRRPRNGVRADPGHGAFQDDHPAADAEDPARRRAAGEVPRGVQIAVRCPWSVCHA
jgi:aspartate/methionine/tyrosine aminotransferase